MEEQAGKPIRPENSLPLRKNTFLNWNLYKNKNKCGSDYMINKTRWAQKRENWFWLHIGLNNKLEFKLISEVI